MGKIAYRIIGLNENDDILVERNAKDGDMIFSEGEIFRQENLIINEKQFWMNYIKDGFDEVGEYRCLITNGDFRMWKGDIYFVVSDCFDFQSDMPMDKFIWSDCRQKEMDDILTENDLHRFVVV